MSTLRNFQKLGPALLLVFSFLSHTHGQDYRHLRKPYPSREYASLEEWLRRAAELREHIFVSTGLWPLPEKTPLDPVLTEPVDRQGYSVQSVVLETLPGFFLTGNLYRPRGKNGPFPGVLSPHGHWTNGRLENTEKASVPGRAINFALQGYVVFTYSMIGFNETAELHPHRFHNPQHELWGFSSMGLQLWNSLRALDFLASLPDIDSGHIGMTGASGGGTQTFMLTAVDDRIRVAAPVNMISAHFQGGCVCENAPLLRVDATNVEIGALAAPRPLLLVSTSGDWTRDTPKVEFPAIEAIYRLFNAEGRVANIHFQYEHNYNRDSREAVYSWFGRWLLGRNDVLLERDFQVEDEALLLASLPRTPATLEELFQQFRERAMGKITQLKPRKWGDIFEYRKVFGVALKHALESPPVPDLNHLEILAPSPRTAAWRAALVVYPSEAVREEAREVAESFRTRGLLTFMFQPYPGGSSFEPPKDINFWTTYNPTVASRRISEIRLAAKQILNRPEVLDLNLMVGLREAGPWVLLARAFLPEVEYTEADFSGVQLESDEAFLNHLFVPLLRRAGDLKTAAVMIVPEQLTIRNLPAGSLRQWFEDIYRAAGAPEMLSFSETTDTRSAKSEKSPI